MLQRNLVLFSLISSYYQSRRTDTAANAMATLPESTRPFFSTPLDPKNSSIRHCGYIRTVPPTNCVSLYALYRNGGLTTHPTHPMLGWRTTTVSGGPSDYIWETYGEVGLKVRRIARGLKKLGIGKGDFVGVYGKNCASWVGVALAVSCIGAVLVPLYSSLGVGSVRYVVSHSGIKVVFCEDSVLRSLSQAIGSGGGDVENIEKIVAFGGIGFAGADMDQVKEICGENDKVIGLDVVFGSDDDPGDGVACTGVGLEDLFCVMYTSGTTGTPKGVMLKNRALVSSVESAKEFFKFWGVDLVADDVIMSYLPLAHIYEQVVEATLLYTGASIGFYRGNPKFLLDDMLALKPTLFPGVPRIFARFQENIESAVKKGSWLTKMLFHFAYSIQLDNVKNVRPRNGLLDMLVFNKIRDKILPRAKLILSSAAPISAQTMDFLRVTLVAPVIQGYGMTESCGPALIEAPNNSISGGTGGPIPFFQIKLKDVPEMDYYSTDNPPRGEMYIAGPMIMTGYYKRERETAECFPDNDGWFATGDIAQWREDGGLEIIDRKKNLFKLAQGEYISPETLEQEYSKCKSISQIWVYGNSFESKLVAIVVPDIRFAKEWAQMCGSEFGSLGQTASRADFKKSVIADLAEMSRIAGFKGYERIGDVRFETDVNDVGQGFTIEKELITPTLKIKRPVMKRKYAALLDEMYGVI